MQRPSLAAVRPDLAGQWHPTRNAPLAPADVTPGSGKRVWWLDELGHEWESTVNNRNNGTGCAAAKLSRPAPARELYTSQLFRKASAYVEATCDQWFILSAKHGLVAPDEVIEPYDVKLGRAHRDPVKDDMPIWDWAQMVADQLEVTLASVADPHLVVLAGEHHRTVLYRCSWPHTVPMAGLGIGEQLGWLKRELLAR